jgi:hypothetical protein
MHIAMSTAVAKEGLAVAWRAAAQLALKLGLWRQHVLQKLD